MSKTNKAIIALDGYSSCGKSTLAKQLAREFNYVYIDTGAMYRAVALYALRAGIINDDTFDAEQLVAHLDRIAISFSYNAETNVSETCLNGENVEELIRGIEVSSHVSKVAMIKAVREKMILLQREIGKDKGVVMDGRDIGSVVFPDAELKLFMTAKHEIRAKRRYDELQRKGKDVDFDAVMQNIIDRDNDDTSRTENPLIKAEDAVVIDNSDMTIEEQFQYAKKLVEQVI